MDKFRNLLINLSKAVPHTAFATFLLVLPIGYYPNSPDSSELSIGVHAGHGQVASVIRDCSGTALHSEQSTFSDISGSIYFPVYNNKKGALIIGLRAGSFSAPNAGFATRGDLNGYGRTLERKITYSYINPNISFEFKKFGIGIGYIKDGPVGFKFDDYRTLYDDKFIRLSWHLRIGNLDNFYFATNLNENTPLASGGGYMDLGFGYSAGEKTKMFTGLGVGFYNRPGIIQKFRYKTKSNFDFDFSIRLGRAGSVGENAFSAGVIFKLGK